MCRLIWSAVFGGWLKRRRAESACCNAGPLIALATVQQLGLLGRL